MLVVLHDGTLEAALPYVPARVVVLVVTLSVRDKQALHDAADRCASWLAEQMKMITQEAVAVKLERLALFDIGQCLEEGLVVAALVKHVLAIVAAVNYVIDEAVGDGAQGAGHASRLRKLARNVKKIVLTPFFKPLRGGSRTEMS